MPGSRCYRRCVHAGSTWVHDTLTTHNNFFTRLLSKTLYRGNEPMIFPIMLYVGKEGKKQKQKEQQKQKSPNTPAQKRKKINQLQKSPSLNGHHNLENQKRTEIINETKKKIIRKTRKGRKNKITMPRTEKFFHKLVKKLDLVKRRRKRKLIFF